MTHASTSAALSNTQNDSDQSQSIIQILQDTQLSSSKANISDLPTELLQKILIGLVQPHHDYLPTPWQDHVRFAAVCKAWRDALLGFPTFWAGVPLYPNENLDQMLARSRGEPLAIRLSMLSSNNEIQLLQSLHLILAERQLAEFHLFANGHYRGGPPNVLQVIDKAFSRETPALRSLKFLFVDIHNTPDHPGPELPVVVLSAARPLLQHLELIGCKVDWHALRAAAASNSGISNLLTLRLQSLVPQPPIDILAWILHLSPNLRTLDVANKAIPSDIASFNERNGPASIPLHSLESCHFSANPSLTTEMLAALDMPEGVRITVFAASDRERVGNHNDEDSADFEQVATRIFDECSISSSKSDTRGSTILHLLAFEDTDWSTVATCALFPWEITRDSDPEPVENVRVEGPTSGFRRMQQLVCAPQIEILRVSWTHRDEGHLKIIQSNADADDWLAFFERHPVLASFSIDSDHPSFSQPLIHAIHLAFERNLDACKPTLPQLRSLSFRGVVFQPSELVWIRNIFSSMCDGAASGNSQRRVSFRSCTVGDHKHKYTVPSGTDPVESAIFAMQHLVITEETGWDKLAVFLR
ncbi:hypothetical protein BDV98DRAFT_595764 [Pterulicium gracile]|uniref:F-box domain-containing protein n=1 Tax=Pterulicium gracile TaxID=1884261 RepID=A0A5C3QBY2_9AGAR|nr:hypothetical protein BDV98DRAFT_595764 [Pterula gracilis]